jgi:osmoprotectant transport system substrate-binding protein
MPFVRTRPRGALLAAGLGLVLALSACGGDDAFSGATTSPSAAAKGELVVGGAGFTEMQVMQQIYAHLLEKAGYTVKLQTVDNREVYAPALEKGEIDVVPEYAATMAEFLNRDKNGPNAKPIATNDATATVEAMRPLADAKGLTVLDASQALDANGYAVTQQFSDSQGVTTLSQLGAKGKPIVLAATEECPDRPFCQPGLEKTYGLKISEVKPLGFGSPQTKQAVKTGDADLGLVGTTDGTLASFGLVLLEDDKKLQLADNLVPVVNTKEAGGEEVATVLNSLADVLTTEDLTALNAKVDQERQKAEDVAKTYLEDKGLL